MNIDDIATAIIQMPQKYNTLGNVSVVSLLKDTGYFEAPDQLSQAEILKALTCHPKCVRDWLVYSEDKRTSEGWYFKRSDTGDYVVGYYAGKMSDSRESKYNDRFGACAAFIKQEIEDIRRKGIL
jgi:hypothetical protein